MQIRQIMKLTTTLLVAGLLVACGNSEAQQKQAAAKSRSSSSYRLASKHKSAYLQEKKAVSQQAARNEKLTEKIADLQADNQTTKEQISQLKKDLTDLQAKSTAAKQATTDATTTSAQPNSAANKLADLNYQTDQEITVNNNNPVFTADDLNTAKGAWENYTNLDTHNRAVQADALLNQSLMPTSKRTALTWDPTGWHNKKTAHGWLYNRSHLIGFQLAGENNNPKNLITGTQSLNNPGMLHYEMDIAYYLKQSANNFVRYRVTPIYRGDELVARGVQLQAQSIGNNDIHFNAYIFNVEAGYNINYADGTSSAQ
ncbi:DNA/RNA non-specific endonuclease [Lapidilactobacillus gannanensis]|uniref:DNA/RNA non-specific endonuclease n=1 Tax=Lapidilactobacillus gannanensis TaxID=2486002 RepID=A0ABW4BQQ4_9LACO|nr:DNA/RNA non-specific endonuclease [Lapidilactobacillus gannanensis]